MMIKSLRNLWVLVCLSLLLVGCVNVQKMEHEKDIDDAVANRVKAAMEYLRYDQPNEAKRHLSDALAMRPKSPMVQNGLAMLYRYLQDPANEEKHLKLALKYDSSFAPAHNNYGIMLTSQKRYPEAIKQFEMAASDLDNASSGLAYANLGRCYELTGNQDKAIWAYQKSMLLNSAGPDIYLSLATIYFGRQDYASAQHYYDGYTKIQNPQGPDGLWLGIRLAAQANNRNAQASYELALKNLYPNSAQYQTWQKWSQTQGSN
jgi:type IV pilus assembly protein PilF